MAAFRIGPGQARPLVMSDLALTTTTLALEADQHRMGWGRRARLFGITPSFTWVQVDEGDRHVVLARERVRTAVAVDRAGAYVAVVRARDGEPEVMPPGGTGALMEELLQVWQRATAVES